MSLRIKLPPKPNDADQGSQAAQQQPPRRRVIKRRLAVESDEDETQDLNLAHRPTPNSRPSHTTDKDSEFEADPDEFDHSKKSRLRQNEDGVPPTKRKRAVLPENNLDEDYALDAIERSSGGDDEELVSEGKRQPGSPAKFKRKGGKSRAMPNNKLFGKSRHDSAERLVAVAKRSRVGQTSNPEDVTASAVPDQPISTIGSPSQFKEPSPPPTKKRKPLPTIKRIKGTNVVSSTMGTTASKATTSADLATHAIPEPPKLTGRAIAATIGNADFDLRNATVYRELFKPAVGGSTPRSGLSRREKEEERRRELNKMRDEARAKRLAEAHQPFDLQLQTDKIAQYEEKLKSNRSSALYPNCLAAKWRERWERGKELEKKQQRKEWQQRGHWEESDGREEGEMNDNPAI